MTNAELLDSLDAMLPNLPTREPHTLRHSSNDCRLDVTAFRFWDWQGKESVRVFSARTFTFKTFTLAKWERFEAMFLADHRWVI